MSAGAGGKGAVAASAAAAARTTVATTVFTRERPQLLMKGGRPLVLVNGVEPGNVSMPFTAGFTGDWAYTHMQEINQV